MKIYLATPIDAYYSKDYEAANKILSNFNIANILDDLDDNDDPIFKSLKSTIKNYFDLPIGLLGATPTIDTSVLNEKTKAMYNKILPGYNENMSIGNFINSFMPYGTKLLYDKNEFTELRKFVAEYIDNDVFSFKNWGLDFDQKLKESIFGKSFLDILDSSLIDTQKKDFFNKFTYAYILLETYGIVQERTGQNKLKKFTFDSMYRDASHAYFASNSDYFVTDDKGVQVKAHILYHLFGIKTEIFSSKDFINKRSLFLGNEETYSSFAESFEYDLNHSFQILENNFIGDGSTMKEYKTSHLYFNYFNRYQVINDKDSIYAFYCRRYDYGNFYIYREIELLVQKLLKTFGVDYDNKGNFKMSEIDFIGDNPIRTWILGSLVYTLSASSISSGNYIVLSLKLLQ